MGVTRQQLLEDPGALDRLIEEHRMLREAIEESPILFCVYDAQDQLLAWNRPYEQNHPEAFAARRDDALAGRLTYAELVRYQLQRQYSGAELDRAVQDRVAAQRAAAGDPVERHYPVLGHLRVMKYHLPSGATAGIAVSIDDLVQAQRERELKAAELERAYETMREQALHDALTGLPNRRYMDEYLHGLAPETGPEGEVALLHLDLDRFKAINDTLGHAAGDFILRHVADELRRLCGPQDFAARVGGDEFTIVRTGPASLPQLRGFAEALLEAISQPQRYLGQACRIGVSIGIARLCRGDGSAATLLSNADEALYQAKEAGRSRVFVYDPAGQQEGPMPSGWSLVRGG